MTVNDGRRRAAPGPRPGLTRSEIVDAAMLLLDEGGPNALTIRRLSARLEVGVMSLYRYFGSRAELEEAIAERVMPHPSTEVDPSAPWHDRLHRQMTAIHDALYAHPGAAALIAERSTSAQAMDRTRETTLAILASSGMDEHDVIRAAGAIGRYVLGCAVASGARRDSAGADDAGRLSSLSEADFPTLRSYAGIYAEHTSIDTVKFGLDLLIRGLRALADERSRAK